MKPSKRDAQREIRVLLVDDEETFRETLAKVLRAGGMEAHTAVDGSEALSLIRKNEYDVVVLDLKMPGLDGIQTLEKISKQRPRPQVILLTGHGSVQAGLEAMQESAFDFLLKPISVEKLRLVIQNAACARINEEE